MAEFKLGRIKFVYQGAWTIGTAYVVDDVVSVGGKTYICVVTHTASAAFATDVNFNPTKWNVVADGAKWLGAWANNTAYNINDQVLYGGIVYQANTAHTSIATSTPVTVTGASGTAGSATITFSVLPVAPFAIGSSITVAGITSSAAGYNATATVTACTTTSVSYSNGTTATYTTGGTIVGTNLTGLEYDSGKWDAFASSFSWQGAWSTNTRYKLRDLITYGGITYLCNTPHLSANTAALGQEADSAKWDTFNAGITYLGAWSGSSIRYKINDVVKYGPDLWICTTYHTSTASFDNTKWSIFVNGFQFENSWTGGTTYQIGDIVSYGGYAYIAKQNHSTSQTPTATSSAYWDVYTTGFSYQGDWSSAGNYYVGSIVRLGGYTYTAIVDNTTRTPTINSTTLTTNFVNVDSIVGLVDNLPITVASSIGGLLNTGTYYVIGSTVASTTGNFTGGTISNGTAGAGTILTIGAVASGANPQVGMFVTGIGVSAGTYIVSGSGLTWQVNNSQYTGGTTINIIGTINQFKVSSTSGSASAVTLSATAGQSVVATTNNTPPFATFWTRLNPGIRYNATNGTYTGVSATNVSSAGASATFNVTRSNSVYAVTINAGGTGYVNADTLKILGTSLGGLSPANDIAVTVTNASGGVIQSAGITATGNAVTWTTGTTYVLGDAVYFGASSYICVSAHIGASGNRPDADTTGTYWNLLAAGTNSAVLTTQGDMYYYGALGATRLPIGTDGQILRVSGSAPAWSYFGIINNVVYVAPAGTDSIGLGQGLTLDKPWKTVRYAAKLIEDGYLNPNTTSLLARNKQFVIKEVSNYVSYTYQASITGTSGGAFLTGNTTGLYVGMPLTFTAQTGSLTITGSAITYSTVYYVQAITAGTSFTVAATYGGIVLTAAGTGTATVKYYTALGSEIERDAGYIFEGVVFDLSHGGTSKSVTNARAYINTAGTGYINTATQSQATTFIGADNYLSTLIGNILAQTAPTANYQTLNSVASPAVQIFDSLITAETGTTTTSQALVTIITNALTAGVSSGIPIAQQPQTTISVKTGTYNEVLPIVIPSYCAITGDELRSTVIQPQTAIANLVNDKPKSINSLNRVKALLSNLAANTAISNSTGHAYVLATTAANSTGGFSTLTFATQTSAPFTVGQKITVSGVTPSGFNGSKTVTACTLTSVSFSGSTAGPQTVAGIVSNQDTSLTAGDTGSQTAVNSVVTNVGIMQNIINNGVVQAPVYSFTNPTGYNTAYLIGFGDAKAQIVQNYQFIKDEISAYFNVNFSSIWSALGASGQALFQTDVQNILDSLQYDMTYGGNTQSQITGSTYYSLFQYVGTAQKAATATVYKRLQTVVMQLSTKTAVSASAGNVTSQVTAGTAGSAAAGIFAAQRVGDVVYWINNSASNTTAFSAASTVTNGATTVTFTSITSGTPTLGALLTANNSITGASIFPAGTYLVSQASGVSTVATGNYSSGGAVTAQTFVLASSTNVAPGQLVVGTGVPAGSYVISSYTSGNTITLVDYLGAPAFLTTQAAGTYSFYIANTTGTYNISTTNTATTGTYAVTGANAITPVTSGAMSTSSAVGLAYSAIAARRTEIQNDTVSWVQKFYQTLYFTTATCFRDAGLIADALAYDVGLGTNFNSIIAGKSYLRAIPSAQYVIANQLAAEIGSINFIGYKVKNIAANGSVITASEIINDAVANITGRATTTLSSVANSTNLLTVTSTAGMVVGQPIVFTGITAFSTTTATATTTSTNVVTLSQSVSTLGIANNMQVYFTGAVFGTVNANQLYYVVGASGSTIQLATTLGGSAIALTTASGTMNVTINNSSGGLFNNNTYWINTIPSGTTLTVTSSYGSGTAFAITNSTSSLTVTATFGAIVQTNGTITYNNTLGTVQGAEILRANKAFLAYEAAAYTNLSYGGGANAVTGTALTGNVITTSANHTFTVGDPVIFIGATTITATITATTISSDGSRPNQLTVSSTTGFVIGMKIVLTGSAISNLSAGTYYVKTIPDSTHITVSSGYNGTVFSITSTQSGTMPATVGGIIGNLVLNTTYYVLTTPSTTTFTITAVQNSSTPFSLIDATGLATARYSYDLTKWLRDTNSFVDAIVYDLQYPGNYKTRRVVELYLNEVNGSTTSDMFRVRNGTGLRNCTLNGLTGVLTAANQYGTKRPTAGAFVALDPGFGPQDTNVWVATRSHYSQNVTMFGTACSGAKIDAALHAGGNKSMVKNDFTTIISDGIGVWCTGAGSLTELVSVFNYYGYAGYLAELGGRMRATNGNSSYGTYGVIAEGTDTYETPINATLNNRSSQAQITTVVTDTLNKILRYEFGNAGQNYTNTVHTTSGAGYGITVIADEFRDASTFETRLTDNGDATSTSVGGTSYVSVANTAQSSVIGEINLAATDSALSAAYVGMRVQLTGGTGVGQYANILAYNNGNKVAQIYKDSFATLTVTGTTTTVLQVASTATLYLNMPIYLGATTGVALSANTLYYVKTIPDSTTFTVSSTSGGTAITGLTATSTQTISLYAAGWDHVVPGTTVSNTPDLTTTYIVEPRISYTGPGYTATARTLSATATWTAAAYGAGNFVAISSGSTATSYSTTGTAWTAAGAQPTSQTWKDIVYGGGQGATATAVLGGFGGSGAVLTANLGTGPTVQQVASVTIVNGGVGYTTPPTIVFTSASGTGAVAICTVLNGAIASVTISVPGSGYLTVPTVAAAIDRVSSFTTNTWGKTYLSTPTVTVSNPAGISSTAWGSGGSATQGTYYSYNNAGTTNFYLCSASGTFTSSGPIHSSGTVTNGTASLTYFGTLATGTAVLINAGVSSITLVNAGVGYTAVPTVTITDSNSRFVAIASGAAVSSIVPIGTSATAITTTWLAGAATGKTDLLSVAYGNGVYIAVGGTTNTASAVSSTDPTSTGAWIDRSSNITATSTGFYNSITFGNGYFVAINGGGGNKTTTSQANPGLWVAGGNLPASTTWTSVAFGNNRFVALAITGAVAISVDNATTWTAAPTATGTSGSVLSSSFTWSKVSYGQGLFFAIAQGTTVCATSPDGINWTVRALPSSSNWQGLAFGNPNNKPVWVAVSNTSGTVGASVRTGAQALGRMKTIGGSITEIRMVEPGSGYPKGNVSATTVTTNLITVDDTTNLVDSQPIEFIGATAGGLALNTVYFVIGATVTSTQFKVSATAGSATPVTLSTQAVTGTYRAGPIATQNDPNKVKTATIRVRGGDGVLGNPSIPARGTNNATATAQTIGDGYSDLYQVSSFVAVANLYTIPTAGANVQFASIGGTSQWYKLVSVTITGGLIGNYQATFQINPALTTALAPAHGDAITTRLKYSQVRLTGHDFLYIGTGNFTSTNYPYVDPTLAIQSNQTNSSGGGRVFFTSTDQDGNFNVGNLFGVQQATGTATLNANAFNLAGLQSLQLGAVTLGVGSAVITSFSTDPYFTANSDSVVPTQKAIKAYITAQIGGGSSSLNVNTLQAGQVYLANNTISNFYGTQLLVTSKMNFTGGIDGAPVALAYFLQK